MTAAVAIAFAAVPVSAQVVTTPAPRRLVIEEPPRGERFLVPVIAGAIVGAMVWPMLVPAAEISSVGMTGVAGAAEGAAAAVPAAVVATPAATWGAWGLQTISSTPVWVGAAIGGTLAYALTR